MKYVFVSVMSDGINLYKDNRKSSPINICIYVLRSFLVVAAHVGELLSPSVVLTTLQEVVEGFTSEWFAMSFLALLAGSLGIYFTLSILYHLYQKKISIDSILFLCGVLLALCLSSIK